MRRPPGRLVAIDPHVLDATAARGLVEQPPVTAEVDDDGASREGPHEIRRGRAGTADPPGPFIPIVRSGLEDVHG
jgi:hypothetical protein